MSTLRRAPRVFLPFALLTFFGPLPIMLIQHDPIHVNLVATIIEVSLLGSLARGSVVSWSLLLCWNAFVAFAASAALGTGMTIGAPLLSLLGVTCVALQLTPSMRHHVGFGRRRDAGQHPATPL